MTTLRVYMKNMQRRDYPFGVFSFELLSDKLVVSKMVRGQVRQEAVIMRDKIGSIIYLGDGG